MKEFDKLNQKHSRNQKRIRTFGETWLNINIVSQLTPTIKEVIHIESSNTEEINSVNNIDPIHQSSTSSTISSPSNPTEPTNSQQLESASNTLTSASTCSLLNPTRKKKAFCDLSSWTKRKNAAKIRKMFTQDQLLNAVKRSTLVENGFQKIAHIKESKEEIEDKALAMILDCNLSKREYLSIRAYNKKRGTSNLNYPQYEDIVKAKKRCYPIYTVSESGCIADFDSLINHTTQRLFKTINEDPTLVKAKIVWKYGLDGLGTFYRYHQKPSMQINDELAYSRSMVIVAFCPLYVEEIGTGRMIWENPKCSSPKFCRMAEFFYEKETSAYTKQRADYYRHRIDHFISLFPTIEHDFKCTMLDGKAVNAILEVKSSHRCATCGNKSSDLCDLELREYYNEDSMQYGIPVLHSLINSMVSLLNLAYKKSTIGIKLTPTQRKMRIHETQQVIQKELYNEIGIIVGKVRQGFGTSSTGK